MLLKLRYCESHPSHDSCRGLGAGFFVVCLSLWCVKIASFTPLPASSAFRSCQPGGWYLFGLTHVFESRLTLSHFSRVSCLCVPGRSLCSPPGCLVCLCLSCFVSALCRQYQQHFPLCPFNLHPWNVFQLEERVAGAAQLAEPPVVSANLRGRLRRAPAPGCTCSAPAPASPSVRFRPPVC